MVTCTEREHMLVMRSDGRTRNVPRGFSGRRRSVSASFREMRLKYQLKGRGERQKDQRHRHIGKDVDFTDSKN